MNGSSTETGMRCLIVVRLSHLTDETTSPERQVAVCEWEAAARGWEVVGVAEDLDVSASLTSPFDRPSLRPWLVDRFHEYDVILFWRVDRLVRRVTHLARMIEWAEERDVRLVSATEQHFDLSTPIGQAIAVFIAVFAQMEADAISQRTSQAAEHNRMAGKYQGGIPPYGYSRRKADDGTWRLFPDPIASERYREMVVAVLDGKSAVQIARDLNERGIPTSGDYYRESIGKDSTGAQWTTNNTTRVLRSPAQLGYVVKTPMEQKNGTKSYHWYSEIVLDENGEPISKAEPLIDRETWQRVQQKLDEFGGGKRSTPPKKSQSLLLRVIRCGVCGQPYYRQANKTRPWVYYRCRSQSTVNGKCGNRGVREDEADGMLTENLLSTIGDVERAEKVYDPGEDRAAELVDAMAQLEDIAGLIGSGPFRSGPARARLEERAEALAARIDELEAIPFRQAGYRYVPTGETFGEHWERLDLAGRNMFLQEYGVTLDVRPDGYDVDLGDLDPMIRAINPAVADRIPDGASFRELQSAITGEPIEPLPWEPGYVETYEPEMPPGWSADITKD